MCRGLIDIPVHGPGLWFSCPLSVAAWVHASDTSQPWCAFIPTIYWLHVTLFKRDEVLLNEFKFVGCLGQVGVDHLTDLQWMQQQMCDNCEAMCSKTSITGLRACDRLWAWSSLPGSLPSWCLWSTGGHPIWQAPICWWSWPVSPACPFYRRRTGMPDSCVTAFCAASLSHLWRKEGTFLLWIVVALRPKQLGLEPCHPKNDDNFTFCKGNPASCSHLINVW